MKRIGLTNLLIVLVVFVTAATALAITFGSPGHHTKGTTAAEAKPVFHEGYSDLVSATQKGDVESLVLDERTDKAEVLYSNGDFAEIVIPPDNADLLSRLARDGAHVDIEHAGSGSGGSSLLMTLLPPLLAFALVALLIVFMQRRARATAGAGLGSQMALRESAQVTTVPGERFRDVAGVDEAVEELVELVDFYRDPVRFELLGARLPAGILLHGDPGTGKTLLAKALAGEAGLPFYAVSGSDFVEKYVGVGASRVRELFEKARRHEQGAVIFIDEIDAVGRARSDGEGHAEREQTLNQILVELDGFSTTDRIVCIAATNRIDVLDPALLRPGRFGRHIAVPLPSVSGRAAILAVHAAGKPLADDVDVDALAVTMGGLSGAQLSEVVNEAAVMAARERADEIRLEHFREGYLRVLAGPKRRSAPIADGELEVIAAHEAGHVLAAEHSEHSEKAQQVTVEPRGRAMGLAVYGQADRALHDLESLHDALVATLGGRAAEQIVFKRVSSGAANDLQKATELARRAVEELGFSPRVGQIVAGHAPFSESTRAVIDSEIERMVADAYADALALLEEHRDELERLRDALLERRVLERVDILTAIGRVVARPKRMTRKPKPELKLVPKAA